MKHLKKSISLALIYIFIVTTFFQGLTLTASAAQPVKAGKALSAVPGQIVFKLRDANYNGYDRILNDYQGKVLSKDGQHVLAEVDSKDEDAVINLLKQDSNIEYVEVNATGKKQANNVTAETLQTDNFLYYSNVTQAWNEIPQSTGQIVVGVVDTGVQPDHPDLAGKVLAGYNFVNQSTDTNDDNGHGTQIAGIIAANVDNEQEVAGVTANYTNVKILPVKVLDSSGNGTTYNIAQGIRYAADNGANIINLSVSGQGYSNEIQDAVSYALSKNCVVVAAAGNNYDYTSNYWPSNSDGAIVVANPDITSGSNFGKEVTLSAYSGGMTTDFNGGYTYTDNETSYSAAVVSGVAALAEEKYPGYTNDQIKNLLEKSTNYNGLDFDYDEYNHYTGYGVVDALKMCTTSNDFIEIDKPNSGQSYTGDVDLSVKALNPSQLSKLEVYLNDSSQPVTTISGNGQAVYNYTISSASLVDGSDKILVKAYSTAGQTYSQVKYISEYKTSDNNIRINIKDAGGNNLGKGTRVFLFQQDYQALDYIASDITDDSGNVKFLNTSTDKNYAIIFAYDYKVNGMDEPVFYEGMVNGSGSYNIDATNLRKIALSAQKADGSPLTGSQLYASYITDKDVNIKLDNVFDSNGNGYMYVSNSSNFPISLTLLNEDGGYLLNRAYNNFTNISNIAFDVDSTVSKVSVSNQEFSGTRSYEETSNQAAETGNWAEAYNSAYSGGSLAYSSTTGSYMDFTFNGTSVEWIGTKDSSKGIAQVTIDGAGAQSVDTYSTTAENGQVLYEKDGLPAGWHTMQIEVTGNKNALSSGTTITVDAFSAVDTTLSQTGADAQINDETLSISSESYGNFNNYANVNANFSTKGNKDLYLSQGDYFYSYKSGISSNNSNSAYEFDYNNLSVNGDTSVNFGQLSASLDQPDTYQQNTLDVVVRDGQNHMLNADDYDVKFNVWDSSGKIVDASNYDLEQYSGNEYQIYMNANNPTDTYSVQAVVDLGPLGMIKSPVRSFNYTAPTGTGTNNSSGSVTVNVKVPFSNTSGFFGDYEIYDKTSKQMVYQGYLSYNFSTGEAPISIDSSYASSNDIIVIHGTTYDNQSFVYNRQLSASSGNTITIDNSQNTVKRLGIKIDDTTRQNIIENGDIKVTDSYGTFIDIYGSGLDSSGLSDVWLENGTYQLSLKDSRDAYFLGTDVNISDTNNYAVFSTANLASVAVNVSNVTNLQNISLNFIKQFTDASGTVQYSPEALSVNNNQTVYVSPTLNLTLDYIIVNSLEPTKGLVYSYNYSSNLALTANSVNNINLNSYNVNINDYSQSVILPDSINADYTITSGGLTLTSIGTMSIYNFMNVVTAAQNYYSNGMALNLYDSNNNLASTSETDSNSNISASQGSYTDYSLNQGTYYLKVALPSDAINVVQNSSPAVDVTMGSEQRIKVLSPFDQTKPAAGAEVYINGNYYGVTNSQGYIFVDMGMLTSPSDMVIHISKTGEGAMYSPDNLTPNSNGDIVIDKTIASLNTLKVSEASTTGKINLSSADITVSDDSGNTFDTNLDLNGQATLYLGGTKYSIIAQGDNYYIGTSVDLTTQNSAVLDNQNLAMISVPSQYNSYMLNISGTLLNQNIQFMIPYDGNIYVSAGTAINYSWQDLNDAIIYSNSFTTQANTTKTINFGTTLKITASLGSSTNFTPGANVSPTFNITDEYNDQISLNGTPSGVKAVVSQNGAVIDIVPCTDEYGNLQFNLPADVSGQATVHFEFTFKNLGTVDSDEIPFTVDTSNYYKISVTDPSGALSNGGTINIINAQNNFTVETSQIGSSGIAYLDKSNLTAGTSYNAIIQGNTQSSNVPFVYQRKYDTTVTSFSANNSVELTISLVKPNNGLTMNHGQLEILNSGELIYTTDFSGGGPLNVWVDKGVYNFQANLDYEDSNFTGNTYLLSNDNVDVSQNSNIVMDGTNVSLINLVYDGSTNYSMSGFALDDIYTYNYFSSNQKVYVTKKEYNGLTLNLSDSIGNIIDFSKQNILIKDAVTNINFGQGPYTLVDDSGNNYTLPTLMGSGDSRTLSLSLKDKNGFIVRNSNIGSSITGITISFSQNGTQVASATGSSGAPITIPALPEGIYDVQITANINGFGGVRNLTQRIGIVSSYTDADEFYLPVSNTGSTVKFYDGNTNIFTSITNTSYDYSQIYAPSSILKDGTDYTLYVSSIDSSKILRLYKTDAVINSQNGNNYFLNEPADMQTISVTGVPNAKLKITQGGVNSGEIQLDSQGKAQIALEPGSYEVNMKGYNVQDGRYYMLDRNITVGSTTTAYNFDLNNLCQLNLNDDFYGKPYDYSLTLQKQGSILANEIDYSSLPANTVYVDQGSYDVKASYEFSGRINPVTGDYSLDCSGTSVNFEMGKNIKAVVTPDKSSYNIGDIPGIGSIAISDGNTPLTGFTPIDFTVGSYDLMYESSVIKEFKNITSQLSGESNIRLNLTNTELGSIAADTETINVSNPTFTAFGDINLDGRVDIFDLVLISRQMGNQEGVSPNWDGRCNLDSSDNVIDIKDLAKAAQSYNNKY